MKKVLIVLGCVFGVFLIIAGTGIFYITRGLDSGKKLEIGTIDLSAVDDGTYMGSYNGGRWSNEVSVTVKDHKITKISVVKDVTFKLEDVTEKVISGVIEKQNTDIDTISGATVTSKAYLKAIENSFKKGIK